MLVLLTLRENIMTLRVKSYRKDAYKMEVNKAKCTRNTEFVFLFLSRQLLSMATQ